MNPFNSDAVNMLSSKNFNQDFTLKSPLDQQPVIIMFYRDGCPHCVHFKPTFAKAAESDRSVVYAAVDTAQNQDLMQRLSNTPNAPFQIQGVPTVAGFNAGKYVKNFEEERTAENVMKFTSSLGGASASGNAFTIPSQTVASGVTAVGSGTITGNTITITYTVTNSMTSNTCTFTGTK
jgi:thioredoxin-like negative regulator of GroEL